MMSRFKNCPKPTWIQELQAERDRKMRLTGGDPHAAVEVRMTLGDVNRLLYILDLAVSDDNDGGYNNAMLVSEAFLLATGALEG